MFGFVRYTIHRTIDFHPIQRTKHYSSMLPLGPTCHFSYDRDSNPHSADQKHQSLSAMFLTAKPRHSRKKPKEKILNPYSSQTSKIVFRKVSDFVGCGNECKSTFCFFRFLTLWCRVTIEWSILMDSGGSLSEDTFGLNLLDPCFKM